MKAIWHGAAIAESDDIVIIEGNHYFPAATLNRAYIKPSTTHTVCPWKGTASYYTLEVDGQENPDACLLPTTQAAGNADRGSVAF